MVNCSFIYSLIHLLIHLLIRLFIRLLNHLFTHYNNIRQLKKKKIVHPFFFK